MSRVYTDDWNGQLWRIVDEFGCRKASFIERNGGTEAVLMFNPPDAPPLRVALCRTDTPKVVYETLRTACLCALAGNHADPYAAKPPPKLTLDMLVTEARCVCCKDELSRGTLVRMKPLNKSAFTTQCGPCAAREWLPLWDEYQARRK